MGSHCLLWRSFRQGIESSSLALQADSLPFEAPGKPKIPHKKWSLTFLPLPLQAKLTRKTQTQVRLYSVCVCECVCECVCVCVCVHECVCVHARTHARAHSVALLLSCALVFAAPWTVDCQASRSMEFSRQQYWSGLSCPTPGDHSNPGIKPVSLASPVLAGGSLPLALPGKPYCIFTMQMINEKNYYEQE